MLERKSSIETEPVTLRIKQIQDAREAALDVLQTRTMEEAMIIFTKGLEEVRGAGAEGVGYVELEEEDDDYELQFVRQHLAEHKFKDVVSAPF